jgi:hypothetical protein
MLICAPDGNLLAFGSHLFYAPNAVLKPTD